MAAKLMTYPEYTIDVGEFKGDIPILFDPFALEALVDGLKKLMVSGKIKDYDEMWRVMKLCTDLEKISDGI